jgi:hypothetical protein
MEDEMLGRVGEENYEDFLSQPGCWSMGFSGRIIPGYVPVGENSLRSQAVLKYWIDICLLFNPRAKDSKTEKNICVTWFIAILYHRA